MILAKILRKIADRLDQPGFREARRLGVALPMHRFFQRIQRELEIRTVLDVGANQGDLTRVFSRCFPRAQIHSV